MDFSRLKEDVVAANKELPARNLVKYSWGNVGAIARERGVIIIKPVGMPYEELTTDNISVVDVAGDVIEGSPTPSVDLPIHVTLFEGFPDICAVVHTHSTYATMWAQAGMSIPCYGTTHADYFYDSIPVTRNLAPDEVAGDFERNTGAVILETFKGKDYLATPGVLVASHGVFTWGRDVWEAVHNAVVLEEIAKMALGTLMLNPSARELDRCVMDKHYQRKHGPGAYFVNDDFGHGIVDVKNGGGLR